MRYPDEVIEEVRIGNDIVGVIQAYVPLRQSGGSYLGRCPFHNDKSPSLSVVSNDQYFHCFGCGAAGNVFAFIMRIENYDFIDALKFLADRINYRLPEEGNINEAKKNAGLRERLVEVNKTAARFFYDNLKSSEGAVAVEYMNKRNLNARIRIKFGLGYSGRNRSMLNTYLRSQGYSDSELQNSGLVVTDDTGVIKDKFYSRLMFPIFDAMGRVIAFGGRSLGDGLPKYLNSPETPLFVKSRCLYGLNYARKSKMREFILVEGYMDVISLHQAGFTNAIAALGTSFTAEHARILKKYADTVIILFDSDEAGTKAAERAIPLLLEAKLDVKVLQVTNAKDPDEYISTKGREAFIELLRSAKNHVAFRVGNLEKRYDIQSPEGRIGFTQQVSKLLAGLQNGIEIETYTQEISKMTNISEQTIKAEISNNTQTNSVGAVFERPVKIYTHINKSDLYIVEPWKKIIKIVIDYPGIIGALKKHLGPDELNGAYSKLLKMVYDYHDKGRDILPAEILNHFTQRDEQDTVTPIFNVDNKDVNDGNLEKVTSELVRKIKRNNIDRLRKTITDAEELAKLPNIKRNLEELNITISDG